ncbi:CobW family GTP-binding protein [Pelosinus fermentans]|uniref:Cobalamin synthesis protein P47K n=2 Tax=Pelosinus TaxID=365348 RepID=I8RDQ7_9FIRM|nr:GTP-binding protein [Pelosinus fermentans]EIW15600.1 cobalamin synthesis protein P47K [Pelosinus fermentans B4]EIW26710.1 cobalamin synthesis protein P47K [Pelosinus fermentans A11]OAM92345.1 cobalamin synthesis protein P47K [Pelosinus fermentans DSM 17108]SDQ41587.1 GTPase, G3E family [Pelosinus fermentans]
MAHKVPLDIVSGFLGAGKTTLLLKLLKERTTNEKLFILENEYGKAGIDGTLLSVSNAKIEEIYSGCICCSLKGEFTNVLQQAISEIKPERILIEPTGIGKLSEVLQIVKQPCFHDVISLDHVITVVDVHHAHSFLVNFGEFYKDQIAYAQTIVCSKTQDVSPQEIEEVVKMIRRYNASARITTTPWNQLSIQQILAKDPLYENQIASEPASNIRKRFSSGAKQPQALNHVKRHSGAETFQNVSWKGSRVFSVSILKKMLDHISTGQYGQIVRAKGLVAGEKSWFHFEYVNGRWEYKSAKPHTIGQAVFIGQNLLSEQLLKTLEGHNAESG